MHILVKINKKNMTKCKECISFHNGISILLREWGVVDVCMTVLFLLPLMSFFRQFVCRLILPIYTMRDIITVQSITIIIMQHQNQLELKAIRSIKAVQILNLDIMF